jgi:hypothetical protein
MEYDHVKETVAEEGGRKGWVRWCIAVTAQGTNDTEDPTTQAQPSVVFLPFFPSSVSTAPAHPNHKEQVGGVQPSDLESARTPA